MLARMPPTAPGKLVIAISAWPSVIVARRMGLAPPSDQPGGASHETPPADIRVPAAMSGLTAAAALSSRDGAVDDGAGGATACGTSPGSAGADVAGGGDATGGDFV